MGLSTSHDAFNGSYSGFMEFRKFIAKEIGINLDQMEGFTGDIFSEEPAPDGISWDTINDDLKILLNHSDCDGSISYADCKKIADRLQEVVNIYKINGNGLENYHIERIEQFIKGCLDAYALGEDLEF